MVGRVVEIATDGRHLSIFRGFIVVNEHGEEVGRIPVDEVAAVIANAHGLTYSNNVLVELSGRGIPVVLCGANHMPAAIVWPVDAHHIQTGRMNDQVAASLPLKKRLWAQLVRAKIQAQGATLAGVGAPSGGFHLLSRKVRSGDPENVEAESSTAILAAALWYRISPRQGRRRHQRPSELWLCCVARRRRSLGDGGGASPEFRPYAFELIEPNGSDRRPHGTFPADSRS